MKIITTDTQLRSLIPHVLATVEGEATLLEKLTPFLETAEEWVKQYIVPDDIFDAIADSTTVADTTESAQPEGAQESKAAERNPSLFILHSSLSKIVANHAFLNAVPSLDLVLTTNGFGIVSNQNIAPASKERVERLQTSLEAERDRNLEMLLLKLPSLEGWKEFASTMFPFLSLCRRLAIREHIWEEYQHLHGRLVKIENVLAETYFSQEQMQVFRFKVLNQSFDCHPLEEQIIRSLQSLEMMLVSDMQCHPQSFYDLVNTIREHEEIFPAWYSSETAKLYTPAVFRNKKGASGYWF